MSAVPKAEDIAEELIKVTENTEFQTGLKRSVYMFTTKVEEVLRERPEAQRLAEEVRKVREHVIKNLEEYINKTLEAVRKSGAKAYLARDKGELLRIVKSIIGDCKGKIIVKSKSMVSEEVMLREHLEEEGCEVWETDLGQFLVQLANEKPMHPVVPALHMSRERVARLLKSKGLSASEDMSIEELVKLVRAFLREKFINADIGITGANSIAADTGAIVLVENEGNIRHTSNLPPVHIAIVSVEKIMPTYIDALKQAIVQSMYAGLYPPGYLTVIGGPSGTADIEYTKVIGAHGPKELHVILYDGGRVRASSDPHFYDQLHCVKCGRCMMECPVWQQTANVWGGYTYGGPMGINWTAILEGEEKAAPLAVFCLVCGRCQEACPMKINMPEMLRYLKTVYYKMKK